VDTPHPRGRSQVAVLALQAAGQGITLTAANTVVFAELHVTPGVLLQAEDRAHRIGQGSAVNVHFLMARQTLDEQLWRMIARKLALVSRALDGKAGALGAAPVAGGALGAFDPSVDAPSEQDIDDLLSAASSQGGAGGQDIREFFVSPSAARARVAAPTSEGASAAVARLFGVARARAPGTNGQGAGEVGGQGAGRSCGPMGGVGGADEPIEIDDDDEMIEDVQDTDEEEDAGAGRQRRGIAAGEAVEESSAPGLPCGAGAEAEERAASGHETSVGCGFKTLWFQVSGNTQRVYVYSDAAARDAAFLGSFLPAELAGEQPPFLARDPHAARTTAAFVREWGKLRAVERRTLADQVVTTPLTNALARAARQRTAPAAGDGGAALPPRHQRELPFDSVAGRCGWCGGGVSAAAREASRFCSFRCGEAYAVVAMSSAVRRQLYDLERGVCQLCGLDAHALFKRVK